MKIKILYVLFTQFFHLFLLIFHPLYMSYLESIGTPTLVPTCCVVINFFFLFGYCLLYWVWVLGRLINVSCVYFFLSWCLIFYIIKSWFVEFMCNCCVYTIGSACYVIVHYVMHTAPSSFGLAHHYVVKTSRVLPYRYWYSVLHTAPSLFGLAHYNSVDL